MTKSKPLFVALAIISIVAISAFAVILITAKSKTNSSEKPYNLIIVSLTNTRRDHLSVYGYKRNTSPNIDNLAKKSLVFDNAYAPASWTLPSGISLFTSLFPYKHKVMNRYDGSKINPKTKTLAKILKKNGYKTASFNGGGDYDAFFGHKIGYDKYTSYGNYGSIVKGINPAINWLNKNKDNRFFLFIQGFDTHTPYYPPKPYDKLYDPGYKGKIDFSKIYWTFKQTKPYFKNGKPFYKLLTALGRNDNKQGAKEIEFSPEDIKHMIALYDGEIACADNKLKKFFNSIKELGLEKNTIIVFLSEHGDMFGEHGRFMRGGPLRGTFYDGVIHIPLIIKHPTIKPKRVKEFVQIVDVMPTLLDMMKIDYSNYTFQGKSALSLIKDGVPINKYIYAASKYEAKKDNVFFNGSSKVEVIQGEKWKLIREKIWGSTKAKNGLNVELYNMLKNDEQNNVAKKYPKIVSNLTAKLVSWTKRIKK